MINKELVAETLATCKERIDYANEVVKRIRGEVKDDETESIILEEDQPSEGS
jgi:uncharacterized membrane-anchored protein